MRVNAGQELVIARYTPSPKKFDALVIGYYDGPNLVYAARTRNRAARLLAERSHFWKHVALERVTLILQILERRTNEDPKCAGGRRHLTQFGKV
jgi:hypothetical protein